MCIRDRYRYIVRRIPIECQVMSTKPRLILSDSFHKVSCEVSKEAVTTFKQYFPAVKFKELTNRFITLLEYEPYTYLDEYGNIRLKLNIFKFVLNYPEKQNTDAILGSPKKLSATSEIKAKADYETAKHLKNFLVSSKALDKLPPLEKILLGEDEAQAACSADIKRVIECPGDDPGDRGNLLSYKELEALEDVLTEEAGKLLQKQKLEEVKAKEQERILVNMRKYKLNSLSKDLVTWAGRLRSKEPRSEAISKGLIQVLPNAQSTPKKSSAGKASEVKYKADGFKRFMNWASRNRGSAENNVIEVIDRETPGAIRVDFVVPERLERGRKSEKKRSMPSTVTSCMKSVLKKPKL
eukprot:TRINITY_DN15108_c0_g2_i2.p1 TRINITY_DN15108_c0_g2~~TRINITY_DN15108_c0_g2_i2.p1  ORF type:complete len:353 (+),score=89.40 TRINITY_DN15108_c0_g2_i2:73-1131(+)